MTSSDRWPAARALRMRHSIFMLCTATTGLAGLAFGFGWRGYTSMREAAASNWVNAPGVDADLAIATALTIAVVGGLLAFLVVLLRRYERLRARIEPLHAGTGAFRAADFLAWQQRLSTELARSRRFGDPLTVAILDLDDFASYSAAHGTEAGGRLLSEFEHAVSKALRASDTVAHCGASAFVLMLPSCPPERTSALLERLREAAPAGRTFAAGVAAWHWRETGAALVDRARRALDVARQDERKRVAVSPSPPPNVDRPAHRRVAEREAVNVD